MITLCIPGQPVAKGRARFAKNRNWPRAYTPAKTAAYEDRVRQIAGPLFNAPTESAVKMTIFATFEPPKSWSKKKLHANLWRWHKQRPDADNLAKIVSDALNGIAYKDDAQIAELRIRKVWGDVPQVVVHIEDI